MSLWELASLKFIGLAGQQAENPGKGWLLQLESGGADFFLLQEDFSLFFLRLSAGLGGLTRPTHLWKVSALLKDY